MHPGGTLLWLICAGLATAAPKIAFVRVNDIYRELPETAELAKRVKAERKAITTDARLEAYREIFTELTALRDKLAETPRGDEREKLEREYRLKRQEALTLRREWEEFRDEKLGEINAGMVEEMEASLARISAVAAEVGASQGYDWVLDSSGKTNTGLPFVLYSKRGEDITEQVAGAVENAPAETAAQQP